MPCPTCGGTLALLCLDRDDERYYHCGRCGTIVTGEQDVYRPRLVDRCRAFLPALRSHPQSGVISLGSIEDTWQHLGIAEAIDLPEDRQEVPS
jgi:endogenous inhibitor of DNA gyrase (YacG/DUF329 family)